MKKAIVVVWTLCAVVYAAPSWFEKPVVREGSLYGLGVGSTPSQAKQNAIVDLSSSLSSSVKTKLEQQTQRKDSKITSLAFQDMSVDTKLQNLSYIQITHSECIETLCYVQVEIHKEDMLRQLDTKLKQQQQVFEGVRNPFAYGYKRDVLYPQILENQMLYEVLSGLKYPLSIHLEKQPSLSLEFVYDSNFQKIGRVFQNALKQEMLKIVRIAPNGEYQIKISVSGDVDFADVSVIVMQGEETLEALEVTDTRKSQVSQEFFAKRLAIQVIKKLKASIPKD
ncbi:hypothetical protein BBW65_01665 [Helicobacter enhydrae]|uniref:Lipoprotein LPP20-like domain-containing protein n=1 Tax=Helicobacter enhydrae TaxID=222136 RepID=A0A1B1U4C4_9HELI|nr:LPP20 family lipoprotein [Helicobacter enhydrae]ANV97591.1 hypothetical protein BBW65_01665 [Helicobacter enhydrae]